MLRRVTSTASSPVCVSLIDGSCELSDAGSEVASRAGLSSVLGTKPWSEVPGFGVCAGESSSRSVAAVARAASRTVCVIWTDGSSELSNAGSREPAVKVGRSSLLAGRACSNGRGLSSNRGGRCAGSADANLVTGFCSGFSAQPAEHRAAGLEDFQAKHRLETMVTDRLPTVLDPESSILLAVLAAALGTRRATSSDAGSKTGCERTAALLTPDDTNMFADDFAAHR
jgi:hypothetical protein